MRGQGRVWAAVGQAGVGGGEPGEDTPSVAAQTSMAPSAAVLQLRLPLAARLLRWPGPCLSSPGFPRCPWSYAHLCP